MTGFSAPTGLILAYFFLQLTSPYIGQTGNYLSSFIFGRFHFDELSDNQKLILLIAYVLLVSISAAILVTFGNRWRQLSRKTKVAVIVTLIITAGPIVLVFAGGIALGVTTWVLLIATLVIALAIYLGLLKALDILVARPTAYVLRKIGDKAAQWPAAVLVIVGFFLDLLAS